MDNHVFYAIYLSVLIATQRICVLITTLHFAHPILYQIDKPQTVLIAQLSQDANSVIISMELSNVKDVQETYFWEQVDNRVLHAQLIAVSALQLICV